MRYPPLPATVIPVVAVSTLVLIVWLGWGSFRDPETLWAPGNVSRYHAEVTGCVSCHEPFRGPVSGRCMVCHSETRFIARANPPVTRLHREMLAQRATCLGCHTEHRGTFAPITASAMSNPHGEFIFRATGTGSCSACHQFSPVFGERPLLLDNETVRRLFEKGAGAHRPGRIADCLTCHAQGRLENEGSDNP